MTPKVLSIVGHQALQDFPRHLEAGLSLGASLNDVGLWEVGGAAVFPDKLWQILPVGCCCHLVSKFRICSDSCNLKGGYPVLRNSVRVPTGWAREL